MQEAEFWSCVQAVKVAAGTGTEARVKALARQLDSLDPEGVQAFQRQYDQMIKGANRWDLWGAAYLMNGGCSDDCFRYFRDWLISEGRETYERALSEPDTLAEFPRREYFDLESFGYVARKVFAAKTGGREIELDYSGELGQPSGRKWSEAELPSLFPRLAAKYMGKCRETMTANSALLTDAFSSLRCACGAAKRERQASRRPTHFRRTHV